MMLLQLQPSNIDRIDLYTACRCELYHVIMQILDNLQLMIKILILQTGQFV